MDNEEFDYVASEHDQLISAVTKLDKTQHITVPSRNEPTNTNSEFTLVKRSKLDLLNAAKLLEDTAQHVQISKKLKTAQNKLKILPKPLEKPQAERIKRETGYLQTKKKIGRWDAVVARSRTVDFVSFPLKTLQTKEKKAPTKIFLSKLKLKSPLEKELEEVDPPLQAEEEDDVEKKFPMTYQEMLEKRQYLAKLRAKESYKAAKAKRQSKIKSKKYHRILKKERLKQQLKEFEELQVKNPEEALKKLQELEKVRALERHTLRHKNTGKWAKSKLVRAKYDKEVRQQLAEQLSVSRSLTHKVQDNVSTDDEADNEVIPDLTLSQDPLNPWMLKSSDRSNIDEEFNFGYKKYLKDKMYKRKESSDSESDADVASKDPKESDKSDTALVVLRNSVDKIRSDLKETEASTTGNECMKQATNMKSKKTANKNKTKKLVATTTWIVDSVSDEGNNVNNLEDISDKFESFESEVSKQVEEKLNKLRKDIDMLENVSKPSRNEISRKHRDTTDSLEYLKLKNQKVKAIIDESLIETNKASVDEDKNKEDAVQKIHDLQTVPFTAEKQENNSNIDPNRFIEVKPKYLNTAISKGENDIDLLDDDEQIVPKVDIEEVFEEDDVVASFRQEKEDEINKDKPEQIDFNLPGWGSWGGKGLKAPKRRRNRFISAPIPKMPRRDENKGDIIIIETKDPKLRVHKVTDVPFPFNTVKDYEASIRAPLGNTFIPEKAHKKLIRPSVITKSGTVIEPMNEEELLIPRRPIQNEAIIKLLAKK